MLSEAYEEYKDDNKRKHLKKKHWALTLSVQYPGIDQPFEVQVQSSLKLKQLKQVIKEKVNQDVNIDQMQLRIEGGDILKKTQTTLDDMNIKDG
jgi:hypothetical protein